MSLPEIISRKEAEAKRPGRYFTDKPCFIGRICDRSGNEGWCSACAKASCSARDEAGREKIRARKKAWVAANPERAKLQNRRAQRKYAGLPEPTRDPSGYCEICKRPPGARSLSLDHCHSTGKFRGWLCFKCNTAIGKLGDTSAGIRRALAYLLRFEQTL